MKIVVVGRGRVGNTLCHALEEDGTHPVVAMGKALEKTALREADLVVIAVPDDAIESVARAISPWVQPAARVVHCAGSRSTRELDACAARGAKVGVMHPLVSFPSARSHPSLAGKTFVVQGDRAAIAACRRVTKACGARVVVAPTDNPIYHAAAAIAANGTAALAAIAADLMQRVGVSRKDAHRAIGGLIQSVGDNVARLGTPDALTGPVARGEVSTVSRHREALRKASKKGLAAYDAVLPVVVQTAVAQGLPREQARALRRLLRD